jgi:hypothetical protein
VKYAKAAYFAAYAKVKQRSHSILKRSVDYFDVSVHNRVPGYHYTVIKNGLPVDTEAVQQARAAHMAKFAEEQKCARILFIRRTLSL